MGNMENGNGERLNITFDKEKIEVLYKSHNIIREKSELYFDFITSLLTIIDDTYLGADVVLTEDDMINHFTWCFNKIIFNFEQERIYFITKGFYDYLWFFFLKGYYTCSTTGKYEILMGYFKTLFIFTKLKTPAEMESFIDLYKIFDQNLKKLN